MEIRDLETAQHEAAHVVVGVALGIRLYSAGIGPWKRRGRWPADANAAGHADFLEKRGDNHAQALMLAAGVAWDRMFGYPAWHSSYDWAECRHIVGGRQSTEACIIAATAMLGGLMREHSVVTRALLVRDLTGEDVARLYRGDDLD